MHSFQWCRNENKIELKDLYEMLDRRTDQASVCLELASTAKVSVDVVKLV